MMSASSFWFQLRSIFVSVVIWLINPCLKTVSSFSGIPKSQLHDIARFRDGYILNNNAHTNKEWALLIVTSDYEIQQIPRSGKTKVSTLLHIRVGWKFTNVSWSSEENKYNICIYTSLLRFRFLFSYNSAMVSSSTSSTTTHTNKGWASLAVTTDYAFALPNWPIPDRRVPDFKGLADTYEMCTI